MKRVVSAILIGIISLGIAEVPDGCQGQKPGGDITHPNASPIEDKRHHPNERPIAPKGKNERPFPQSTKNKEWRKILFVVLWEPARPITISWSIGPRADVFSIGLGSWKYIEQGSPGEYVTLKAEQFGYGGQISCFIYVDNKLWIPQAGEQWKPYEERMDAGDCNANILLF